MAKAGRWPAGKGKQHFILLLHPDCHAPVSRGMYDNNKKEAVP